MFKKTIRKLILDGDRRYNGIMYKKKVGEFGLKFMNKIKQSYIHNNDFGTYLLVPEKDIIKTFNPFNILNIVEKWIKNKPYENLLNELKKVIPTKDIGFIGSYLIGFPQKNSDIDIVIRGKKNLKIIKEKFSLILKNLNARNDLSPTIFKISLDKYNKLYNEKYNDFAHMIKRRWPTIRTNDYTTKLRFAYKNGEEFPIRPLVKEKEICLDGEVIEDEGTNFMPRTFKLKTSDGIYDVMTYFWDFTYCVKKGDIISIKASLFNNNLLVLYENKRHGIKFKNK